MEVPNAVVVVEDDLEAGASEEAEETNVQTIFKFVQDNFNRAVRNSICQKALVIMPTFPATFCFTLPSLLCLAQIKWQLTPHGFPSSALRKWYIVCVTSLFTEFVASVTQWIISAAGGKPNSVYNIIALLGRIACYFVFLVSLAVLLYS